MLLAPATAPTMVRSSLEVMLDSIRQKDEKPKELMPALPARPTSRARLPSARRSLPVDLKVGSNALGGRRGEKKEEVVVFKVGNFGGRNIGKVEEEPEESPYFKRTPEEERLELCGASSPSVNPVDRKLDYELRKELRVWCCLPEAKWEIGKIQSVSGDDAHILLSDGKVLTISTDNLAPANPNILDGVDDLIQLSYLNEPSVIHNLQYRYSHNMIYTKAGPVLVALNPFKEVPLYGNELVTAYRQKRMGSPHVFGITDNAFSEMMRDGKNQSIIISGESGAGKTETAKFAMQYLAALGGSSGIEYEVLQTNLILESFGNAKTLRNDNSSRFGKLIEIYFSGAGKINGAKIETFLLEKSRVVQRAMGERSYHVFYQLCAGAPPHLKEQLNLKAAEEYEYLKQSNCSRIDDVDDAQRFHMLVEAFDTNKICKEDQENAFAMLATVLWLGNIGFSVIDNENHVEVDLSEGVTSVAKLIGCEVPDLMLALSTRKIQAGNDNIVQKLTISQAIDTRDALAKLIYASLFDWLVEKINKSLDVGKLHEGRSISILDIYGFESFHRNNFEQLCINYANERLQQHFNRHLFKLEQEEYAQNGIDWKNVDFVDNAECLNLFEKKPIGLLSLLDEESAFPDATDMTFANKLKQHLNGNSCFKGERGGSFRISHFAGEVRYNTSGFLEKNRDLLHSDCIQLLSSCSCRLPQLFASRMVDQSQKLVSPQQLRRVDFQKQTVGRKFKDQLFRLMEQLESTTPHFIRCIKPNDKLLPGMYEYNLVLQQLRCCGVLEGVRIARSGYPTRMTHQQFAERYGFLLLENVVLQDPLSVSVRILQQLHVLPDMYQVGYTKIFFRTGQIAALEDVRNQTLHGILCVQKLFRGFRARHYFQELKNGVTVLQSFIRGRQARKHFISLNSLEVSMTNHGEVNKTSKYKLYESKDSDKVHPQPQDTVFEELQRRVQKAEASLRQKEEENLALQQKIQQYETRWLDYEVKMKSMEEMWQKQMTSLQVNLAAAKKSLAADDTGSQPGGLVSSPNHHYFHSENTSGEFCTPASTPAKQYYGSSDGLPKSSDGARNAVSHMVKEFEQQKQVFENDARFLIEVKSGHSVSSTNPSEEFQKLKAQFVAWKKEYKVRLRETKVALRKFNNSESVKPRKRWWVMRISK